MSVRGLLDDYRRRFRHGRFILDISESINAVVRRENVPSVYGVYSIATSEGGESEILYLGKAGTLLSDGTFKAQTMRKRLTMKQDGIYRREFFRREMESLRLSSLRFQWFDTFGTDNRVPPFLGARPSNGS